MDTLKTFLGLRFGRFLSERFSAVLVSVESCMGGVGRK
jgi:hypothetical protein